MIVTFTFPRFEQTGAYLKGQMPSNGLVMELEGLSVSQRACRGGAQALSWAPPNGTRTAEPRALSNGRGYRRHVHHITQGNLTARMPSVGEAYRV